MRSLGEKVKDLRTTAGMSQLALAVAAKTTPQTIGRLERQPDSDPSLAVARNIARVFDLTLAELFEDVA